MRGVELIAKMNLNKKYLNYVFTDSNPTIMIMELDSKFSISQVRRIQKLITVMAYVMATSQPQLVTLPHHHTPEIIQTKPPVPT